MLARREGTGEETGGEIWDPLDISGSVGDEALMWFRASELKHGRVAMLASVGYLAGAAGITFPGDIANGVSFASVNANGVFSAWSNVPEAGKLQVRVQPVAWGRRGVGGRRRHAARPWHGGARAVVGCVTAALCRRRVRWGVVDRRPTRSP